MTSPIIVVDWQEPRRHIVRYLCHIYNIPDTVPFWEQHKVSHYYKIITNYCILSINNRTKFMQKINELKFIEELFEEDIDLFYDKSSNLQELLLYLLNYLSKHLGKETEDVYVLHSMNYDYISINLHTIDKEADNLVFNQ